MRLHRLLRPIHPLWRGKVYHVVTVIVEERIPDANVFIFCADEIQIVIWIRLIGGPPGHHSLPGERRITSVNVLSHIGSGITRHE